jgi:hypothetical protein
LLLPNPGHVSSIAENLNMPAIATGKVMIALGILVVCKSKKQTLLPKLTMHPEMIATAYGKVLFNRL